MSTDSTTPPAGGGLSRRSLFRAGAVAAAAAGVATAGGATAAGLLPGAGTAQPLSEPLRLARVWAGKALLTGFDDTHVVYGDGSVQYLLWPGDLARLQALGVEFEIEVEDVVARDAALPSVRTAGLALQPGETTTGDYRQLEDFKRDMDALAAKYPDKARVFEAPHRTANGSPVYGIEIATDVTKQDGRPVFYQDGCHHAREWPAAEVPIMWAYDLLENYETDNTIKRIVDNVRNIIIPVVNVDGFRFTREAPPVETGQVGPLRNPLPAEAILLGGQARYTRKNRKSVLGSAVGPGLFVEADNPVQEQATLGGVDPNRNYSYYWGDDEGGSSADAFSQTYRGTDPLSEQETKNVAHVLKNFQVLAMNTNHTSGDLLLWAWGDTRDDAPDNDLLEGLGRAMATYNGYRPQKSIDLYLTTGTCSDYAYGLTGSIGYTFEHAGSSFHPPYPSTVPAMYERNRKAFILLCSYVCLTPEQRGSLDDLDLTPEAEDFLQTFGLGDDRLAHAIIKGRAVTKNNKPVPGAVLTLEKTVDTLLWAKGDGNPLGQRAFQETLRSTMVADDDGTFEWHVNPSTRPANAFAGEQEHWTLTVTGPDGVGVGRRLFLERGDIADLGEVVVS